MNENIVMGNWKQLSGRIKAKWGKLTDNDLEKAEGNKEYLLGKLQEHYGLAKDKAEQNLKDIGHL
ncbi:MAG: CsbD family protein [Sulfuricaulis sp.]